MIKTNNTGIKVYIASPYTKGDVAVNVKRQIDTAHILMDRGFLPYAPLLCHYLHLHRARPYEDWVKLDNAYVLACDVVLRLPGESKGADAEVKLALDNNIPVFYSLLELEVLNNMWNRWNRKSKYFYSNTKK